MTPIQNMILAFAIVLVILIVGYFLWRRYENVSVTETSIQKGDALRRDMRPLGGKYK